MKNRLFLGTNEKVILDCYTKEQIGNSQMISACDVIKNKGKFNDVEYIFATWGIPELNTAQVKEYFPKLKAFFYGGGSVQFFARPYLENNIALFSGWAANAIPVAEFVISQILLANKGYFQMQKRYKQDRASCMEYLKGFEGNYHTKIGLLGAGMIGKYLIGLLKQYDLEVLVFDPFLSEQQALNLGVKKASLEEIFASCQTISNHIANNEQTVGMLNYKLFSLMKDNATFINTGRGAQVVESDLIKAMNEQKGRTALLDVTFPEPPLKDSELWQCDNIILTPHRAGSVEGEIKRMGECMLQEYELFVSGKPTRYHVTFKMLETMA